MIGSEIHFQCVHATSPKNILCWKGFVTQVGFKSGAKKYWIVNDELLEALISCLFYILKTTFALYFLW